MFFKAYGNIVFSLFHRMTESSLWTISHGAPYITGQVTKDMKLMHCHIILQQSMQLTVGKWQDTQLDRCPPSSWCPSWRYGLQICCASWQTGIWWVRRTAWKSCHPPQLLHQMVELVVFCKDWGDEEYPEIPLDWHKELAHFQNKTPRTNLGSTGKQS